LKDTIRRGLRMLSFAALGAAALGAPDLALAQSTGAPAAPGANAQVGFEKRPQLSTQDELAQADLVVSRVDAAAGAVRTQLDTARQGRDVVKSLCLSDKLSQIDVGGRSARERGAALVSAVQRNDVELANHEYAILAVLRQRTEQLVAEANQCIGEEVAFVGQTVVQMTEANVPGIDDTTSFPPLVPLPVVVLPPPTAVSPTR
jgi:hypothetical protein